MKNIRNAIVFFLLICLLTPASFALPVQAADPVGSVVPLSGRWSGGRKTNTGLYDGNLGVFTLRHANMNEGYLTNIVFGSPDKMPIAGDWDGNNTDTIGFYDRATARFFLRNANTSGYDDLNFQFGNPANPWTPIVGDWDGDKRFGVGLYDQATGRFFLRNTLSTGPADFTFYFGPANVNAIPLAGDWDGDGKFSVGVFLRDQGLIHLTNKTITAFADTSFYFGAASMLPVVGDWDGNGTTTIGMYGSNTLHLKNSNATGFPDFVIDATVTSAVLSGVGGASLNYFGYYNTNGAALEGDTTYIDEIASDIDNVNILHILVDAYNNDIWQTNLRTLLNRASALGKYKVIVNISRVTWESYELPGPYIPLRQNWQARTDQLLGILDQYTNVVYTLYYDEPYLVGRTTADFRLVTGYIRAQRPTLKQMAIEYGESLSTNAVPPNYMEFMDEIGIDYYYTFPIYGNNNFNAYRTRYEAARSYFAGKRVWIIPEGWTVEGTDARNLIDALNEYYSFALYNRTRDNIVGMLSFAYPNLNFGPDKFFLRDYLIQSSPKYDANFRALSVFIGKRSGSAPD
jgi:hypothetical protein